MLLSINSRSSSRTFFFVYLFLVLVHDQGESSFTLVQGSEDDMTIITCDKAAITAIKIEEIVGEKHQPIDFFADL